MHALRQGQLLTVVTVIIIVHLETENHFFSLFDVSYRPIYIIHCTTSSTNTRRIGSVVIYTLFKKKKLRYILRSSLHIAIINVFHHHI